MFEDKKAEGIEYQYIYSTFEQPAEVFFRVRSDALTLVARR